MPADERNDPVIWSHRLTRLPQEERVEQLEELLLPGDLSFWDDAAALREYIDRTGLSQSACAKKLGRSQAGVANRLRLLKLSTGVRERMREHGLSERHARAVLRLENESAQQRALDAILSSEMNVAQTEAYIEECLAPKEFDAAASVFSPLLSELEKLRVRMPDIEYRLAESPEMIRFIILIPQKYDQT